MPDDGVIVCCPMSAQSSRSLTSQSQLPWVELGGDKGGGNIGGGREGCG